MKVNVSIEAGYVREVTAHWKDPHIPGFMFQDPSMWKG